VNIHDYERTAVVVLRVANRCDGLQRHTTSCDREDGCAQMDNFAQRAVGGLDPSGSYNAPFQLLTLRLPPNKSLDASGTSALVIDNLSVTQLSPAASTQPLYGF
jgi:hypothetical protein